MDSFGRSCFLIEGSRCILNTVEYSHPTSRVMNGAVNENLNDIFVGH